MTDLGRRIGLVLATMAVSGGVVLAGAPAASAAPAPTALASASAPSRPPVCRPEHRGPDWRWDRASRHPHWDHRIRYRDRHDRRWRTRWVHVRMDDRYCARQTNWGGPGRPGGPGGPGRPEGQEGRR